MAFRLGSGRPVTEWVSQGVRAAGLLHTDLPADISCLRFEPDAHLGRHPAGRPQVFALIEGEGWVSGSDGERQPIVAGQAAVWDVGESHESGSGTGMTVIVIQAERLDADLHPD